MITFDPVAHTYHNEDGDKIPSVTNLLEKYGYLEGMQYIKPWYAQRGTLVHSITEQYDYGLFDIGDSGFIDPEIRPYIQAYEQFLEAHKPKWSLIEEVINHGDVYAGKLDRAGVLPLMTGDKTGIFDIKTSSKSSPWHEIQTAGYSLGYDAENWEVIPRGCIYLRNDGTFQLKLHTKGVESWRTIVELEKSYADRGTDR